MCSCRISCPSEASTSANHYAPSNLLKAGIITIQLNKDAEPDAYCEDEEWHTYSDASYFLPLTNLSDVNQCQELEFLVKHHFIFATYRVSNQLVLILRIYLIPYDLPGAKGALHVRKENILSPARRYLRSLLLKIVKDEQSWEGHTFKDELPLIPDAKDCRTLAEIYSELRSPKAGRIPRFGNISGRLLNYGDDLKGLGMRSKLYRYQRRSIAAMMQRELDLRDIPDPLFLPHTTVDNQVFYFQPGTMEILLDRPMVAPCRGGILCEELGTGKTVMIIGLILATRKQLPTPEESFIDPRPVMTPLSLRYFPSDDCVTTRGRLSSDGKEPASDHVPSLVEILLHRSRVAPDVDVPDHSSFQGKRRDTSNSMLEDILDELPLGKLKTANVPFYYHHLGEPMNNERNRRKQNDPGPKKMYLSPATLVVVPPNLLGQWDREIMKHCEYPLRVLILRAGTPIPPIKALATDYDVILMTYTRFTSESNHKDISKLHSYSSCKCPEIPGSRIPNCTCQVSDVSPFLQIRWKRMVIDEGHVSASLSTILTPFAKLLSVERRWIVTGTPTTNLLGLSLGKKGNREVVTLLEEDSEEEVDQETQELDGWASIGDEHGDILNHLSMTTPTLEESPSTPTSRSASCPPSPAEFPAESRVWNKYDREDLRKLGTMVAHFIAVPQFVADSKLINTHVTEPLLDHNGSRPGAIQVLNQVMEMVMIRHRIEDIEEDVLLPALTQESVLLDLDPMAIKSYNALQATIAINAVDSERKDKDYMFHSANAGHLQSTVKNMSQLMFWSVDEQLYNVDQLYKDAQEYILRARERNISIEDMSLLEDAFRHVATAAQDTLWRSIQSHEDVPYRVYSMPEKIYVAWRRTSSDHADLDDPTFVGLLHADRLLKLYDLILRKPLTMKDAMIRQGQLVATEDQDLRTAYLESQKKAAHKSTRRSNRHQYEPPATSSRMVDSAAKKATAKETLKEMRSDLGNTMILLDNAEDDDAHTTPKTEPQRPDLPRLPRPAASSPLAKTRVGSSTSTKLNYIINEVLQHSAMEKFLIFSDSELSLAHVAEALELIHVKFLRFTTQIQPRFREQLVLTFETSETYRVFLMELKHGARGLNLVSASRVIFCEPVWQADVESQAIKRVHRIGQTRPITVKTLAIRGTAEENMVIRRNALHNSQDKLPKLIEEVGMRHFIANPKFIEHPPTLTTSVNVPFLDLAPPQDLSNGITIKLPQRSSATSSPSKRVRVEDPIIEHEYPILPLEESPSPSKKIRSIRFA